MQLIVQDYNMPEAIEFNYEEIKAELTTKLQDYKTLVYTESQIKEAKADRSTLNKLKKALNDERIRREKEYLQPFTDFKNKISELCSMIDEASKCIDVQVKEAEEKIKAEKQQKINELYKARFKDMQWMFANDNYDAIANQKWLNSSNTLKSIDEELEIIHKDIANKLLVLGRLSNYSFEAMERFKRTLNLEDAIAYADELKQDAEAKAEAERLAAEYAEAEMAAAQAAANAYVEEEPQLELADDEEPKLPPTMAAEPEPQPTVYEITFKVNATADQLRQLMDYMHMSGIEFSKA